MDKKKLSQYAVFISLSIMVLSILAYLNFGGPKELNVPKKSNKEYKEITLIGNITNKTNKYYVDFIIPKKLNLSSFNITKIDYINNINYYDAQVYLRSDNITKFLDYLKENKAKIETIKRNVLIEVNYLNNTRSTYYYVPIEKINKTIKLTCYIKFVDNVPIELIGCKIV